MSQSNWAVDTVSFGNAEVLSDLMQAFARALLYTPDDTYAAAMRVFPQDPGKAMFAARYWPLEQLVRDTCERLLAEHGAMSFLPNKVDVAREIIAIAKTSKSEQQKLSAWRQYSELMDMLPHKTGVQVNNNNTFAASNKVMQVVDYGSDDNYQRACEDQQQRLLAEAEEDLREVE